MTDTSNRIKRSAIPLSGYVYQNLVGLNLLCDWLEDPALYEWVQFEADHDEVPQGLDDVVAQRWDSTFVLLQVKFTVEAVEKPIFSPVFGQKMAQVFSTPYCFFMPLN